MMDYNQQKIRLVVLGSLIIIIVLFSADFIIGEAPAEFGNATTITCNIGGDLGIVNCTGNITTLGNFVGNGSGLNSLIQTSDFPDFNDSMKVYVDTQDVIYDTSMVYFTDNNYYNQTIIDNMDLYNGTEVNDSITAHNTSIKVYVDEQNIIQNTSLKSFVNTSITTNITSANASIKVYVDTQDSAQDACNEITNCVPSAWVVNSDIDDDEITEAKIAFSTACAAGNHYYLNGNDLACEADADTTIANCSSTNSCANIIYETELDDESELEGQLTDVSNVYTNNDGSLGNTTLEIEEVCYANVTKGEWITPSYVIDIDDEDIETDLNTYVDIEGDDMIGDLNSDGTINATIITGTDFYSSNGTKGITNSSFFLCMRADCEEAPCYQETANVSTLCGGLSSGSYGFTDTTWTPAVTNAWDGSWSTGTEVLGGEDDGFVYINYTKPLLAIGAKWEVKDDQDRVNLSLPVTCFNNPEKLILRARSITVGALLNTLWYCFNGTDNQLLRNGTNSVIVEEAIHWNISATCQVHIINGLITGCT